MKKRWMLCLLLISILIGSTLSGCKPAEAQTIKVGNLVALTGGSATWGQSENNALKLVVDKINTSGGVNGKKIELITYDNRADKLEAVNVAKRMVEQDKVVAIIGPAQSGVANAIREVNNSAKVPLVSHHGHQPQGDRDG